MGASAFIALRAGEYRVSVIDANGCTFPTMTVSVEEPEPIIIDLGEDRIIQYGDTARIIPQISGTYPIVRYQWSPADSSWVGCFDCPNVQVFPDYQRDLYLTVTDANGCTAEEWVRIVVRKDFPIQVPTGFTPNNDGQNDRLTVHGLPGIEIIWFRVFDRWGEQVFENAEFETNDPAAGWDGRFRDRQLNSGVYLWQLEARLPDGRRELFQGQTTLIR